MTVLLNDTEDGAPSCEDRSCPDREMRGDQCVKESICKGVRRETLTCNGTPCRHSEWRDGHCAEMICPNYINKCSKHTSQEAR